ncbi:hypothetical protein V1511DRAFT_461114 [Dipodascopsis uninucleata]
MPPDYRDIEIDELINNLDDGYTQHKENRSIQKRQDFERLVNVWQTERVCPDILQFQEELIETMMERIREQIEFIEEKLTKDQMKHNKLQLLIIETDLERVKFLIRSYLRSRIHKASFSLLTIHQIDRYHMYILSKPDVLTKLSSSETRYVQRYASQLKRYYDRRFLSSLPKSLQRLDDTAGGVKMIEAPDTSEVVFFKVLKDSNQSITLGEDDTVTLEQGNIYVLPYNAIKRLVKDGTVQLV